MVLSVDNFHYIICYQNMLQTFAKKAACISYENRQILHVSEMLIIIQTQTFILPQKCFEVWGDSCMFWKNPVGKF